MSRDTTNVEHEMFDYTGNNWSHRNSYKRLKEKFGGHTRKTFGRFSIKSAELGISQIKRKVLQFETGVWVVGITVGSREVPGRKGYERSRHSLTSTIIIGEDVERESGSLSEQDVNHRRGCGTREWVTL